MALECCSSGMVWGENKTECWWDRNGTHKPYICHNCDQPICYMHMHIHELRARVCTKCYIKLDTTINDPVIVEDIEILRSYNSGNYTKKAK